VSIQAVAEIHGLQKRPLGMPYWDPFAFMRYLVKCYRANGVPIIKNIYFLVYYDFFAVF
jgi:hypothetical protein